jgi:hypothetical protein
VSKDAQSPSWWPPNCPEVPITRQSQASTLPINSQSLHPLQRLHPQRSTNAYNRRSPSWNSPCSESFGRFASTSPASTDTRFMRPALVHAPRQPLSRRRLAHPGHCTRKILCTLRPRKHAPSQLNYRRQNARIPPNSASTSSVLAPHRMLSSTRNRALSLSNRDCVVVVSHSQPFFHEDHMAYRRQFPGDRMRTS